MHAEVAAGDFWDTTSVQREFQKWSKPSTDRRYFNDAEDFFVRDDRRTTRLATAAQHFMMQREREFRASSCGKPLLACYQADATSYLVMWARMLRNENNSLRRDHQDLCEFLSEKLFLVSCSEHLSVKSCVVIHPARTLKHGKTASCHVAAMRERLKHPMSGGDHHSIAVSYYCWDRACFDACYRMAQQYHAHFWLHQGPVHYPDTWMHVQGRDIVLGTGCAIHDIARALKWASAPLLNEEELKAAFLAIEGLRKGARYLHNVVDEFIDRHVLFDDGGPLDEISVQELWEAVGVAPDRLASFVRLRPRWVGDRLRIKDPGGAGTHEAVDELRQLIVLPWTFRKMNTFR